MVRHNKKNNKTYNKEGDKIISYKRKRRREKKKKKRIATLNTICIERKR